MSEIIHKLVQPTPKEGLLINQILCWRDENIPVFYYLLMAQFSTDINNVTCVRCRDLWVTGTYV